MKSIVVRIGSDEIIQFRFNSDFNFHQIADKIRKLKDEVLRESKNKTLAYWRKRRLEKRRDNPCTLGCEVFHEKQTQMFE